MTPHFLLLVFLKYNIKKTNILNGTASHRDNFKYLDCSKNIYDGNSKRNSETLILGKANIGGFVAVSPELDPLNIPPIKGLNNIK